MTITIADGRGALWQWDTGRRVKITDGADVKQIHYQNRCFGCSVDVDVGDDGTAIIPDELLQDYHTLTAYAYVTDDAGGYTKVQQDFAVYKRPKPSDYIYTPTEHAGFDRLRAEIGELSALQTNAKNNLVAAINEAAASESMGLRVADGYIQYSTDSGSTWQNLIALAELKGAGMDITGATVGQIAKITAVDASGVPTAWSPADMPSGGSPDAVLYTPQTLTDAQKKQARQNIDAASVFVINATPTSDLQSATLDKTFAQIQEAINAGKIPIVLMNNRAYLQILDVNTDIIVFSYATGDDRGASFVTLYVYPEQEPQLSFVNSVVLNSDNTMPQVEMDYDPTEDMEIATKKYVDDSVAGAGGSVPKPLTYDYMPDGYPKKSVQTTTLMEEQDVEFVFNSESGAYGGAPLTGIEIAVGKTYSVNWDGTEYECVGEPAFNGNASILGNLSIIGLGDDTGEPFVYLYDNTETSGIFATLDTSASHTISVQRIVETVTPMAEEYLPENIAPKSDVEATQKVLDGVFSSVATFTFDKQTSGRDTFKFNAYDYYKISDFNPAPEDVISFKGASESGDKQSHIKAGNNCVQYGYFIIVASAGRCSIPITDTVTGSFTAPSAGLYASYDKDNAHMTAGTAEFTIKPSSGNYITGLFLKSCTHGSTKKFKITVDDTGTLKAIEVTE